MARQAMARAHVCALRQEIARIEGTLPQPLPGAAGRSAMYDPKAGTTDVLPTGAAGLDRALGGGVPAAGLTELHGAAGRDSGALAGFALALASRAAALSEGEPRPLLWIGVGQTHAELGFPHAPGIRGSLRPRCRPAADRPCQQAHRRAVGRRRGRRAGGARRHRARGRRQSCLARPDGNEAASQARPGGLAAAAPAAAVGACRADRRGGPPAGRSGAGGRPSHLAGSVGGSHRRARLRHFDRQEPHVPSGRVHCGVESP